MIQERKHEAVAIHHEFGTVNDKEQIVVTFSILEGPDKGETIAWFGFFTDAAYERTMDALRYCGWKGVDLMDMGDLEQKVYIVVEHETYENKTRPRVKWVNKFGGGVVKLKDPMDDDKLRMFAAQMRAKAEQSKEVEGEKVDLGSIQSAPPSSSSDRTQFDAPPPGDSDIPWDGQVEFG